VESEEVEKGIEDREGECGVRAVVVSHSRAEKSA
jgi:hypothetical protein